MAYTAFFQSEGREGVALHHPTCPLNNVRTRAKLMLRIISLHVLVTSLDGPRVKVMQGSAEDLGPHRIDCGPVARTSTRESSSTSY